jgi:HlyD family secretion protein
MKLRRLNVLLLIVAMVLSSSGCSSKSREVDEKVIASGFVEGQTYHLIATLGGRVDRVEVALGERIDAQQLMIQFDTQSIEALHTQAQAGLAGAMAVIDSLEERPDQNQLTAAQANLSLAEVNHEVAQTSLDLLRSFYEPLDPPKSDLNRAQYAIDIALAEVDLAQATLDQVVQKPLDSEWGIAQAGVAEAQANIALIDRQLEELSIRSPIAGVVSQILVRAGEIVPPGGSVALILDASNLHVTLYVPVGQIALIDIGDRVQITTDSYPDEHFEGQVTNIADQAQFTPTLVLTAEERVKLVFAVEVRIESGLNKIKPGMPVDAEIISQ